MRNEDRIEQLEDEMCYFDDLRYKYQRALDGLEDFTPMPIKPRSENNKEYDLIEALEKDIDNLKEEYEQQKKLCEDRIIELGDCIEAENGNRHYEKE